MTEYKGKLEGKDLNIINIETIGENIIIITYKGILSGNEHKTVYKHEP